MPTRADVTTIDITRIVHGQEHLDAAAQGSQLSMEMTEAVDRFLNDEDAIKKAYNAEKGYVGLSLRGATVGAIMLISYELSQRHLLTFVDKLEDGTPILCFPTLF